MSVSAGVWLRWAFGGRGGLQSRAGLDWTGLEQVRTGGWVGGRGWVERSSVFGTPGCGPGGLQGGIQRYKRGQAGHPIDKVSRKEEEFREKKKKKKSCRANNGRSCDACARTQVHKACIFSRSFSTVTYLVLLLARQERDGGRERGGGSANKKAPHSRIKVPMLQAAHAITTCRRVGYVHQPARKPPSLWALCSGIRLLRAHWFPRPAFTAPCPSLD